MKDKNNKIERIENFFKDVHEHGSSLEAPFPDIVWHRNVMRDIRLKGNPKSYDAPAMSFHKTVWKLSPAFFLMMVLMVFLEMNTVAFSDEIMSTIMLNDYFSYQLILFIGV